MTEKKSIRSPFRKKERPKAYKMWKLYVEDITHRSNFHAGHLDQLEILCKLYQELDDLENDIEVNGFSVWTSGRYGEQIKTNPAVAQKNKTLAEIRAYSKILHLNISAESSANEDDDDFA